MPTLPWQSDWLQGEVLEEQMRYWRRNLGEVEPLALPSRIIAARGSRSAPGSGGAV